MELKWLLVGLVVGLFLGWLPGVGDRSIAADSSGCMDWLRSQHSLDYPGHGCQGYSGVLESLAGQGASAIPLGGSRFYIAWFPEGWESQAQRVLIVTLHGSGGCAERMYRWWARPAAEHGYALIALQYAWLNEAGEQVFSDAEGIYADLKAIFTSLAEHCPLEGAVVVLHGFSRGSARVFELALLDRAEDGLKLFSAFIADSGTGLAETGGELPKLLAAAPPDAYAGATFWLYCGGRDHGGKTCGDMRILGPWLEEHGATVVTYRYEPGGHGIFSTVRPGEPPSPALTALLAFIGSLKD